MNTAMDGALKLMFDEQKEALMRSIKIKLALKKAGLSQKAVAQELGVTEAAVSRYVNGNSKSVRFDEWCERRLGLTEGVNNG